MIELFRRFSGRYRLLAIVAPLTKLIEAVFDLLTPLVIARMVDAGIRAGDMGEIRLCGALLAGMAILGFCFTLVCQKLAGLVSQGMGTDIRNALYEHMSSFSPADLDRFGTATLITRITSDVNQFQVAVALVLRTLLRWPLIAVGSVICAMAIDPALGSLFLVSTALVVAIFYLVMSRSVPLFARIQELSDVSGRITRENLSGVRQVRAFTATQRERTRFAEVARELADRSTFAGILSGSLSPATMLVLYGAVCLILLVSAGRVDAGILSTGQVIAFVAYMTQTLLSVNYVANLVVLVTRGHASSLRVLEVLDAETAMRYGAEAALMIDEDAPALELTAASLAYPQAAGESVSGVTLMLAQGQTLGIIGGTGSGKTSLMRLATRLYDASRGTVELFGNDIRDYTHAQLRSLVGTVPQTSSLLSGTLAHNLRWADPDATDEELYEALERAQAMEFVSELGGLEMQVEANGANLSGGQRQRICIARALIGHPRLVVLDDASSALDAITDAQLVDDLIAVPGITRVMISQRISTMRSCDIVCVLDAGQVVGLGTHEELRESCPVYAEICELQAGMGEVSA